MLTAQSASPNLLAGAVPFALRPLTSGFRPSLPGSAHLSPPPRRQRTPTEVLIDNSNDRPDISAIAVLGYN
ncbi:hypothetical protein [Cupriavidus sp. D384]|uniref:hypothetical protein n=1 Tax=Cupriavidus sp. D384 TaxID=1538095 RepID=UPI000B18B13E|nr:hypothetical protein [Cupriavidus sp. D384]